MAQIGLFRSERLNNQGQQIVKAIVVGDDLPEAVYVQLEQFLKSDDDHVLILSDGIRVGWMS